mgnify:CR=1 FL=1
MIDFQFSALPARVFAELFSKTDRELDALGARRMIVDVKPGFPCRVSLVDAEPGEEVVLLPFIHHDVPSPYRASGPVFVRKNAETAYPAVNEIPQILQHRQLSLRAYDRAGMMVGASVAEGRDLRSALGLLFENQQVEYIQVHNAKPGCFNCTVRRVG